MTSALRPNSIPSATIQASQNGNRLNAPTLHTLSNGMTIIAEQLPVDAVNFNLWLNVGSILESDEINGMAHFLEHMIFKGTQNLKSGEFEARIEARGAVTNAATSQDYTHYYITTAPQDFADLAPLQLDVLLNPTIDADPFDRERHVVLEEIRRSDDNARRRNYQRLSNLGFQTLPYHRPVLGPTSVIETLKPSQMQAFHQKWYHPSAITAVAVGNLPVDQLIATVEKSLNQVGWSAPTATVGAASRNGNRPRNFAPETVFTTIERRSYDDPTLQQARLMLVWRVPGLVNLDETYALDIIASLLSQGRTARLVQDLRETQGLVSGVGASNMSHQYQGLFTLSANLPTENIDRVERALLGHIKVLQNELVHPKELEKICTQVANHFIFSNETPSDRANLYGYYHALMGDLEPAFSYADRIRAITPQDIQNAAQKYLPTDALGIMSVKPIE
ncbi:MAG: insulinase family protein [Alkalinema sp. FL-bin-369]|jgi:predicted Zn-dependent peptidase|nr:insulinase family protein [Leptolyngbyaceae cyanobacterium LF-bin-369]